MLDENWRGTFQVIDAFGIKKRKEFYIIGSLTDGKIKEDWYVKIPVVDEFIIVTAKIRAVETIEMPVEKMQYSLAILTGSDKMIDFLLSLPWEEETFQIVKEGDDSF